MTPTISGRQVGLLGGILILALLVVVGSISWVQIGEISGGKSADFFADIFKTYMPRASCMYREIPVIWLHIFSDAIIALSYYSIPVALIYFVRKRGDLTFSWMFVCFAIFILACGTTHVMNIISIWNSYYRIDALVKVFTAFVSIATAAILWLVMPLAIALPSPGALRLANEGLAREIEMRKAVEASLLVMQGSLEQRVLERTAELERTNTRLQEQISARALAEMEREKLLLSEQAARAEAEQSSRTKDEFLATLSHELRTPLSAITGWVHILRQEGASAEEISEGIAVIERNTRLQTELIEDLLDMSRILSGKLRLEVQEVDLLRVINGAIETVQLAADAKGVALQKVLETVAPVSGDPGRLQQILWNLLMNAIKFTPRGGRVQVALERVNSHVEISVSDNGAGIAPEFLPLVFERFRQADSSTTRRHGGLGLGLAIVRHLIELNGGTVRAKSPGLGKGSTFVITLPVRPVSEARSRAHPTADLVSERPRLLTSLAQIKVLLVDDEPDTREVLRRILEQSGASVETAGSAAEGFAKLSQFQPDILVSDIGMPDQDGYSFLKQIRELPAAAGGATPAIALTAFARAEDRIRAMLSGFQMHLAKPIEPSELVVVVASLARR